MVLEPAEKSYLLRLRGAFVSSGSSAALYNKNITVSAMFTSGYFKRFFEHFGYKHPTSEDRTASDNEILKTKKKEIESFLAKKSTDISCIDYELLELGNKGLEELIEDLKLKGSFVNNVDPNIPPQDFDFTEMFEYNSDGDLVCSKNIMFTKGTVVRIPLQGLNFSDIFERDGGENVVCKKTIMFTKGLILNMHNDPNSDNDTQATENSGTDTASETEIEYDSNSGVTTQAAGSSSKKPSNIDPNSVDSAMEIEYDSNSGLTTQAAGSSSMKPSNIDPNSVDSAMATGSNFGLTTQAAGSSSMKPSNIDPKSTDLAMEIEYDSNSGFVNDLQLMTNNPESVDISKYEIFNKSYVVDSAMFTEEVNVTYLPGSSGKKPEDYNYNPDNYPDDSDDSGDVPMGTKSYVILMAKNKKLKEENKRLIKEKDNDPESIAKLMAANDRLKSEIERLLKGQTSDVNDVETFDDGDAGKQKQDRDFMEIFEELEKTMKYESKLVFHDKTPKLKFACGTVTVLKELGGKCVYCARLFENVLVLQTHMISCGEDKESSLYPSSFEKVKFPRNNLLKQTELETKCEKCLETFVNALALAHHIKSCDPTCYNCCDRFVSAVQRNEHMASDEHKEQVEKFHVLPKKEVTEYLDGLQRHQKKPNEFAAPKKPVFKAKEICPICNYGSGNRKKLNLEEHMKLHQPGAKFFKCDFCTKCFPTESRRRTHMLKHETIGSVNEVEHMEERNRQRQANKRSRLKKKLSLQKESLSVPVYEPSE